MGIILLSATQHDVFVKHIQEHRFTELEFVRKTINDIFFKVLMSRFHLNQLSRPVCNLAKNKEKL